MRQLLGIGLAALLGLTSLTPALAQVPEEAPPEDVLGEQVRADFEQLPAQVKIDLLSALIARGQLLRGMARVENVEGEAVLGEQARRDDKDDETMQEMLRQLQARAKLDEQMGAVSRGWSSMPR